ncbi:MAG: hypothetical protein J2P53_16400, partial [Bradyrhizobiaceae bacterium]|nr:hypothetical protein [Bradyrhizobiaceae bacterium]
MEPHPHRTATLTPSGGFTGRAIVIGAYLRDGRSLDGSRRVPSSAVQRPAEQVSQPAAEGRAVAARLDEAVGLARAIDLDVVDQGTALVAAIR